MLKLYCTECNEEFLLVQLEEKVVRDDIQSVGFTCPSCQHEYISYYTNSGIRDLQALQQKLKKSKKSKRLLKDIEKRIKVGMDRLKGEMS